MVSLNVDFNDFNRLFNSALVAAGFCASETPRRRDAETEQRNGQRKQVGSAVRTKTPAVI